MGPLDKLAARYRTDEQHYELRRATHVPAVPKDEHKAFFNYLLDGYPRPLHPADSYTVCALVRQLGQP
jgi:hypothetical protein